MGFKSLKVDTIEYTFDNLKILPIGDAYSLEPTKQSAVY